MRVRARFTLVELLVTGTMLALLSSAGYVVFAAGVRSAQAVRRVNAMVGHGERALTAMARDIRAIVTDGDVALTALDAQYEGGDTDTIDFIGTGTRRGRDEPGATVRSEVGYYIDNDPDTEAQWLLRREDGTLDEDPLSDGIATLAGPCVSELNLEFFDGVEWLSGWEDQNNFPLAVRINIVVVDPDEVEAPLHLETTISIPTQ